MFSGADLIPGRRRDLETRIISGKVYLRQGLKASATTAVGDGDPAETHFAIPDLELSSLDKETHFAGTRHVTTEAKATFEC